MRRGRIKFCADLTNAREIAECLRQAAVCGDLCIYCDRFLGLTVFAEQIGFDQLRHRAISRLVGLGECCQLRARFFFLTGAQFVHGFNELLALQVSRRLLLVVIYNPAAKGEQTRRNCGQ